MKCLAEVGLTRCYNTCISTLYLLYSVKALTSLLHYNVKVLCTIFGLQCNDSVVFVHTVVFHCNIIYTIITLQ